MSSLLPMLQNPIDEQFLNKIQKTIQTVQAWDADPLLLLECRLLIPFDEIRNDYGPYSEIEYDSLISSKSAIFIQRLARFFRKNMKWMNQPSCSYCCTTTDNDNNSGLMVESVGIREPETIEEREGDASRVEVYKCTKCQQQIVFPRYNSVRKLLQTWTGRCGEYANLFGLFCRAAGYETRYVADWTDHVWTEVYIPDYNRENNNNGSTTTITTTATTNWIMVDSCEGVIDENSMYECGWNKSLNMVVAVGIDHCIDVTTRYTRKYNTTEFQARRRVIVSSESIKESILDYCNTNILQSTLDVKSIQIIQQRLQRERNVLEQYKSMTTWEKQYANGRISGSISWRLSRHESTLDDTNEEESKTNNNNNESDGIVDPTSFYIEPYYTPPINNKKISIRINSTVSLKDRHGTIQINGVSCAMNVPNSVSVVVIDNTNDTNLGCCILQSKSFCTIEAFTKFISRIPNERIICIHGKMNTSSTKDQDNDKGTDHAISEIDEEQYKVRLAQQLGGFQPDLLFEGIMFVGQILAHPDWVVCEPLLSTTTITTDGGTKDDKPIAAKKSIVLEGTVASVTAATATQSELLKLRTVHNVRPTTVIGRVDDTIMTLADQLTASNTQKRTAFLKQQVQSNNTYSGYTTKRGSPIYLLGASSYPLCYLGEQQPKNDNTASPDIWNTFLVLPSQLVDPNDNGIPDDDVVDTDTTSTGPQFEIPIDDRFFVDHIGSNLYKKTANRTSSSIVHTLDALRNTRLIGFYFSAHWCGPCRSFTPMLAEMYEYLKEQYPTHGLEIVFVSSDRDDMSFQQYYASMPWLAIPFDALGMYKQLLSIKYGVRGIPSFVVLDSMTGEIVVPPDQSRQEIAQACHRGGDTAISALFEKWLQQIPTSSREMIDILQLSCSSNNNATTTTEPPHPSSSQLSSLNDNPYLLRSDYIEQSKRIQELVDQLMADGMDKEEAIEAAWEVENVSTEADSSSETLPPGNLNGFFKRVSDSTSDNNNNDVDETSKEIAQTIITESGIESLTSVLSTVSKYIENAKKAPWKTKFRSFNLSFKVADRITRVPGGIPLIQSLGMEIYGTTEDFVAAIPFDADLELLHTKTVKLLEWSKTL